MYDGPLSRLHVSVAECISCDWRKAKSASCAMPARILPQAWRHFGCNDTKIEGHIPSPLILVPTWKYGTLNLFEGHLVIKEASKPKGSKVVLFWAVYYNP